MQYKKFIIINYRAIEKIEIPVSNSLVPIIGINESGKTSILKAILAFDKLKDNYNKGEHLNYKNKYQIGTDECYIKAEVKFENEEEVERISKRLKLRVGEPLHEKLKDIYNEDKGIIISRTLSNGEYYVEDLEIENGKNKELAKKIFDSLPFILYFDDFSDRVPETISFPPQYIEDPKSVSKSGKNGEWRSLLEEIFLRSTDGKYNLSDFLKIEDEDDQVGLLSDVSDVLNEEIIEEWKKLKKKGRKNLTTEEDDIGLEIKFNQNRNENENFIFEFKVYDKTSNRKKRQFNITERSKGFQWYFNFIVKLKFNSKYKDTPSNAIYLLDEPGSYLHSSAQEELLQELKEISSKNILLYCTHSQYLLDPEVINVSSIKIAVKQGGKINLVPFSSYKNNDSQGALTPIIDALHLKIGFNTKLEKNILITEGITDYYLIKMLKSWNENFKFSKFEIIPGAGADKLKDLISLAIAWSQKYMVLFDNDEAGVKAKKKYEKFFGEEEGKNFYLYNLDMREFTLEDFFTEDDAKKLLDITGVDDIKTAITALYFHDNKREKERFIKKLDFKYLQKLHNMIETHFS